MRLAKQKILKWEDYSRLPRWSQCDYKGFLHVEERARKDYYIADFKDGGRDHEPENADALELEKEKKWILL